MNRADHTRHYSLYLSCLIALITFMVFSPVLWHDFVNLDDNIFVYANPNVQSGVTPSSIYWAFTTYYASNWIPLTWILHMLNVQMFGMNPSGHHFVNVLLHVGSSVVLFLFLRRATDAPLKSAVVAVLFALHPLHVESVAWVSEGKDVLSAFFWMLTMYAYLLYGERPGITRYLTVLGLFALGLLSKSMVVTLPVVLLLLDWWPLGRFNIGTAPILSGSLRLLVEKLPFFFLSAVVGRITYLSHRMTGDLVSDYTLLERASRSCISYVVYIRKMIWPDKLAVFYPFVETPPAKVNVVLALLALLLITGLVLWLRKRMPFLVTGWNWYIVTLLPVIGLIQIGDHDITDRYTYIPLIGLFVVMVWGGAQLAARWQVRRLALCLISCAVIIVMIIITTKQIRYWKNTFTLLSNAIEVTDNNWLALNNLGQAYLDLGRIDDAIWYFNESVKAKPTYVIALVNLGALYSMKNDHEQAAAFLKRALLVDPGNEKALLLLGLLSQKR